MRATFWDRVAGVWMALLAISFLGALCVGNWQGAGALLLLLGLIYPSKRARARRLARRG